MKPPSRGVTSFSIEGLRRRLDKMERDIADLMRRGDWRYDLELIGGETTIVSRVAAQSIPDNTTTAITFDTVTLDEEGWVDLSVSATRITVTESGVYLYVAAVTWANNNTGRRYLAGNYNGSINVGIDRRAAFETSDQVATRVLKMNAGDYITTVVNQSSGGALDVSSPATASLTRLH